MPIDNPDIQPWPLKDSEIAADFKIFKVRSDQRTSPRTGDDHSFFVIESVDWCNVVALTANDELVMVEQYRQGTNLIELELPGGMIDPGETPAETAPRELREETGYAGDAPEPVGFELPAESRDRRQPRLQAEISHQLPQRRHLRAERREGRLRIGCRRLQQRGHARLVRGLGDVEGRVPGAVLCRRVAPRAQQQPRE